MFPDESENIPTGMNGYREVRFLSIPPMNIKPDKNPTIAEEQKRDYDLFFVEAGDPDFSPERNKAIIERTIQKHEMNIARKNKIYEESIRERVDAVMTYANSPKANTTPVEKYFGKQILAQLRGEQIMRSMKARINNQIKKVYLPE